MTNTETINTNMRKGFTMIELIFVIVIIGILAAVAIPKLAETSIEAKRAKVVAFVGTLNRTVGPTMWAKAVKTNKGVVDSTGANLCSTIATYIDLPDEVTMDALCKLSIDAALGSPAVNTFTDGSTVESPKWKVTF